MAVIDLVAKELHMKPQDLISVSLKTYIRQKISKLESELFLIAKKYDVCDVFEMEKKIKGGLISENDSYDDFFKLDNIEAELDKLKKIIEKL